MRQRPVIGITCNYDEGDQIGMITSMGVSRQKWQFLADNYMTAVEQAGGIPVIIPIYQNFETFNMVLSCLNGVILSGGNDVSPECYGEHISDKCGVLSAARDKQDLAIASCLLERKNLPVLGICRGIQVVNVAAGGTLHQDLHSDGFKEHSLDDSPMNQPVHTVRLREGTKLRHIFGCETLSVNSYHHSAVDRTADCFSGAGESEDGVLEAIELKNHPFFMAVQWHPEMMFDDKAQQTLFKAFIAACEENRLCSAQNH